MCKALRSACGHPEAQLPRCAAWWCDSKPHLLPSKFQGKAKVEDWGYSWGILQKMPEDDFAKTNWHFCWLCQIEVDVNWFLTL